MTLEEAIKILKREMWSDHPEMRQAKDIVIEYVERSIDDGK